MSFRIIPLRVIDIIKKNKIGKKIKKISAEKLSPIKQKERDIAIQFLGLQLKKHFQEKEELSFFNQSVLRLLKEKSISSQVVKKNEKFSLLGGTTSLSFDDWYNRKEYRNAALSKFKLEKLLETANEEKLKATPSVVLLWTKIINLLNRLMGIIVKNKKLVLSVGLVSFLLFIIIKKHLLFKLIFIKLFIKLKSKNIKQKLQKECFFPEENNIQDIWLLDSASDDCPAGSQPSEHY